MPSQRPLVIPPHAILDPTFCSEFGRPVFAWHSNSGRIGVAGGGVILDRAGRLRGVATSGVTRAKGAISFSGAASTGIDFGVSAALQFQTTGRSTIWTMFNAATTASDQALFCEGYYLNAAANLRYFMGLKTTGYEVLHTSSTSTYTGNTNNGLVSTGIWYSVMTVFNEATALVANIYHNGANETMAGNTTQSSTMSWNSTDRILVGCQPNGRGNGTSGAGACWNGLIGPMLVWYKAQPQRLAVMLDGNPAMAWWWPGKIGRAYSIPGGTVSGSATLLGYGTTTFVSQAAGTATILPDVSVTGISQAAGTATIAPDVSVTSVSQAAVVSSIAGVGLVTSVSQSAGIATITGAGALITVSQSAGVATLTGIGTLNVTSLGTVVGTATLVGVGAIITVGQAAGIATIAGSAIVISISQSAGTATIAGAGLTTLVSQSAGKATMSGFGTLTATAQGGTVVSGSITMTGAGVVMAYGYLYTAPIPTPVNEGGWSAGSVGPGDWTADTVPAGGWTSKVILPGGWE